jgi:hypothetical protein
VLPLKPTELAVKELSKESSNLLTCEGVFKFLFDVLAKQLVDLVSLLKYLQNPNMIQSEDDFKYSSKAAIINCEMDEIKHDTTFESFEDEVIEANASIAAQMQKSIPSVALPPFKKADPF